MANQTREPHMANQTREVHEPLKLIGHEAFWWDSYEGMGDHEILQFHACMGKLQKNIMAKIDGSVSATSSAVKQNVKEYFLVEQFIFPPADESPRGLGFKGGHFYAKIH